MPAQDQRPSRREAFDDPAEELAGGGLVDVVAVGQRAPRGEGRVGDRLGLLAAGDLALAGGLAGVFALLIAGGSPPAGALPSAASMIVQVLVNAVVVFGRLQDEPR